MTRLTLIRDQEVIFQGVMAAGMVLVSGPGQQLDAEFFGPSDFVHLYVCDAYVTRHIEREGEDARAPASQDFIGRDTRVARLSMMLLTERRAFDDPPLEGVAEMIVLRVADLQRITSGVMALPKWRLMRVQDFVAANIDQPISLREMAQAAGFSRMHFAGQFRAATGYRPHDYVLAQRIERAKTLLLERRMPLIEIALAVGFQAQAHFCTVFKRYVGKSPGRWRKDNACFREADLLSARP